MNKNKFVDNKKSKTFSVNSVVNNFFCAFSLNAINVALCMGFSGVLLLATPLTAQAQSMGKQKTQVEQSTVLKVSFANQENSPKGKSLLKFKSLVETRTNGKVKVELYPFAKLIPDNNELEALELGVTDIIIPNTSKVASELGVKELELFDLPYLITSKDEFSKIIDSDINQELLDKVSSKNKLFKAVVFWGNGLRGLSFNKPITKVEDMKAQVFASQYSLISADFYKSLGSSSVKVTENQILKSLTTVDSLSDGVKKSSAADNTLSNFAFLKLYEGQKYFFNTAHAYSVYVVLVNERRLSSLSENEQKIIIDTLKEVQVYHQDIADEDNLKSEPIIKEKSVVFFNPSDADKKILKEKAAPIHESFVKSNKNLMLEVYKTLKDN